MFRITLYKLSKRVCDVRIRCTVTITSSEMLQNDLFINAQNLGAKIALGNAHL